MSSLTIIEANNKLENIDNKIRYYLAKKELELTKLEPKSIQIKEVSVEGGKRVDRYANYVINIEEYDKELNELYAEKKILEEYIENELIRLGKYREVEQLIIYYKEQITEKLTWQQISFRTHYSISQCKRIYRKWAKKRDV